MVNNGRNVKVDVQFWRVKDGISESLNGTERRDTNSVIEQYVGRYEDFVLTALSLQGNNTLFIDKSQSERKDLMAQFMGLDIFDKLYEAANEDIKEVSALIRNFKRTDFTTELSTKETDLKESKKIVNELEITLKDFNSVSDFKREMINFKGFLVGLNSNKAMKGMSNSDLYNIRDEILGDVNQFLYLLTFK